MDQPVVFVFNAGVIGVAVFVAAVWFLVSGVNKKALKENRKLRGQVYAYRAWLLERLPVESIEERLDGAFDPDAFDEGARTAVGVIDQAIRSSNAARAFEVENRE